MALGRQKWLWGGRNGFGKREISFRRQEWLWGEGSGFQETEISSRRAAAALPCQPRLWYPPLPSDTAQAHQQDADADEDADEDEEDQGGAGCPLPVPRRAQLSAPLPATAPKFHSQKAALRTNYILQARGKLLHTMTKEQTRQALLFLGVLLFPLGPSSQLPW